MAARGPFRAMTSSWCLSTVNLVESLTASFERPGTLGEDRYYSRRRQLLVLISLIPRGRGRSPLERSATNKKVVGGDSISLT